MQYLSKYLFSIIIFGLVACNQPQETVIDQNEQPCTNKRDLYSVSNEKVIEIDYSLPYDSIMDLIQLEIGEDLCWNPIEFGIPIPDYEPIKVGIKRHCKGQVICINDFPEVIIMINPKGEIMAEMEFLSIDSLKFWIGDNFPNNDDYDTQEVSILWDRETPADSIEKVMKNIIDGYLICYEDLSSGMFDKSICELSTNEIHDLKDSLPFRVGLYIDRFEYLSPEASEDLDALEDYLIKYGAQQ